MAGAPVPTAANEVLSPILDDLNQEQREAVTHGTGPLLILAGAGTGKTSVITRRIAWLIATKRARPSEILALTFTEKAAAEMEERVDVLVPYGYADVTLSTFHAFGRQLVAEYALLLGLPGEPRVLDEAESMVFLREHLFDLPVDRLRPLANPTRHLAALRAAVDRARDEAVSPEEYAAFARSLAAAAADDADREEAQEQEEIAAFYAGYLELLESNGFCDYGQLVWLALRLLDEHPRVRRELGERYRYILVDEFQDTNVAQFQLLQKLCDAHQNVTVVGDDDQSIYQFRGASFANLLHFLEVFPQARRVVLVDNYRSTQPILDSAYRLIRHNDPDRLEVQAGVDKRLVARKPKPNGPIPAFQHFDTASSEAEWVAQQIRQAVEKGGSWGNHAVLVRTHRSAKPVLQTFSYRGIPHRYVASRGLYDTPEVQLCEHLLRVVADPGDSPSVYELASSEVYRVPAGDLAVLSGLARRRNRSLSEIIDQAVTPSGESLDAGISEGGEEQLRRMQADVAWLRELALKRPSGEVLYRFLERSGWIERLTSSEDPADERKVQNLALLFNVLRGYADLAPLDRVVHFVRHLELLREAGDNPPEAEPDEDDDAVHVLTVHRAKGLEFPVVYLVDLVEGRFPGARRGSALRFPDALRREKLPTGDAHKEEERRLFYVGMTRAQEELHLSGARDLGGKRMYKPSRFVAEALDTRMPSSGPQKASALEALARHAPDRAEREIKLRPIPDDEALSLSHEQVADYCTCPLKYKFAHILRVPLLPHHGVVYGLAIHNAIRAYYRQVLNGWPVTIEDVLSAYQQSWRSEGFLTREHEEARFATGQESLRRFFERETRSGITPHSVEREFRFRLGPDVVRGRFDRVDLRPEGPVVVDFKSSDVREQDKADARAADSLQLKIYALAHREQFGSTPVSTELHFVDSGVVGRAAVEPATLDEAIEAIETASQGIRRRDFGATPSYSACRQCAFLSMCPERYGG
jgi:DNA helicase-2/ATP-dependent DNA helicase PcrA